MNFPRKDSVLGIEWSTNERFKERKFQGTNGPGIVSQILVFVGRIILDITEKHSVALICRKIWGQGQSGQAIKLFQSTPYVHDFRTLNNPGSWQPVHASKN